MARRIDTVLGRGESKGDDDLYDTVAIMGCTIHPLFL